MVSSHVVDVFPLTESGGNPAPVVLDARGMSDQAMQELARSHGLESSFVLPPTDPSQADFRFRFFVPLHEMEMCGHATIGTLWLLREANRLPTPEVRIETLSGLVHGFVPPEGGPIWITQPRGTVESVVSLAIPEILVVLGIGQDDLAGPIVNAKTSRTKTLVPLASPERLNTLTPHFERMESLCTVLDSTGLYPFAADRRNAGLFHARQFPKAVGYPEDPATGIAASALAFGLFHSGAVTRTVPDIRVRQGEAMGRPSEIHVRLTFDGEEGTPSGCLLGGICRVGRP